VISVAKTPTQQFPAVSSLLNLGPGYKALWLHENGGEEFFLHNVPLQKGGLELEEDFLRFLRERIQQKDNSLYLVENKELVAELLQLEQKHSRKLRAFKVAVLYVTAGQTDMTQIFANRPPSGSQFYTFLEHIARRIDMDGWEKYRGDMGIGRNSSWQVSLLILLIH